MPAKQGLAQLYADCGDLVHERCHDLMEDDALASDAVEQTYIRAAKWAKMPHSGPTRLSLILRIALHTCFNFSKKRKNIARLEATAADENSVSAGPFDQAARLEGRDLLHRFFGNLSREEQEIVAHYYVDELPMDRVAQLTGYTRPTIHRKLKKIRSKARRLKEAADAI